MILTINLKKHSACVWEQWFLCLLFVVTSKHHISRLWGRNEELWYFLKIIHAFKLPRWLSVDLMGDNCDLNLSNESAALGRSAMLSSLPLYWWWCHDWSWFKIMTDSSYPTNLCPWWQGMTTWFCSWSLDETWSYTYLTWPLRI